MHNENISVNSPVTRLPAGRPRNLVGFPAGAKDFSLLVNVQTGSGAHPI